MGRGRSRNKRLWDVIEDLNWAGVVKRNQKTGYKTLWRKIGEDIWNESDGV